MNPKIENIVSTIIQRPNQGLPTDSDFWLVPGNELWFLNASVRGRVSWLSLRLVAARKLPPVNFFFVLETSSDFLTATSPTVYLFMKISGGKLLAVRKSPLVSNMD